MPVSSVFFSKILLFGEYSVIRGSMALALPFALFTGKLKMPTEENRGQKSHAELLAFFEFYKGLGSEVKKELDWDESSLEFDLKKGLFFESSIPKGYGVGSSGALCAALFDRYSLLDGLNRTASFEQTQLHLLKRYFQTLESKYHGPGSGLDPLVSYLSKPILLKKNNEFEILELSDHMSHVHGAGAIFLLDTGCSRSTAPLVELFLKKLQSPDFARNCEDSLATLANLCIDCFLRQDFDELYSAWLKLSELQFDMLPEMIPDDFRELWKDGTSGKNYLLKLCGAGGGGFLLGITHNLSEFQKAHPSLAVRPVLRFYS